MSSVVQVAKEKRDKRWNIVDAHMRRHGYAQDALLETLHAVQDTYGYLDRETLARVANALRVPLSKVYGVATFYNHFTLNPLGEHAYVVCTGTACYIKDAAGLITAVENGYDTKLGQTTADGKLSLLAARCVGACGIAPVAVVDGETVGKVSTSELLSRLNEVVK